MSPVSEVENDVFSTTPEAVDITFQFGVYVADEAGWLGPRITKRDWRRPIDVLLRILRRRFRIPADCHSEDTCFVGPLRPSGWRLLAVATSSRVCVWLGLFLVLRKRRLPATEQDVLGGQ